MTVRRQYADRSGCLVRVLAAGSHRPVGVGFLVDDTHLVTCAHVVNIALGRAEREQDEPDTYARVPVDFPILGDADGAPVRLCRVARWLPPPRSGITGDDFAGLAIVGEGPPAAAGPARMPEGAMPSADGRVHVFGQPAARQSGAWATAWVRGRVGGGLLQVDSDPDAAVRLQPGYSGSPLVLVGPAGDVVVGMLAVASVREDSRDAYGMPVERLVRAWPDVLAGIPPCPYPGLRPFAPPDEHVFIGRDEDTDQLAELVEGDTLALVVGPSGIGKSSLVNAGLIPRWRADGGAAVTIRPGPAMSRPLRGIVAELNAALHAATGLAAWSLDVEEVAGGLAAALSRRADSLGTRVLVHLDQFEELLTGTPENERQRLVDVLLPVSRDPTLSCRVVVTMRADHLPALLELPGQGARLRNRLLTLSPMSAAALERAVSEPARARGVVYEPGLAEQIATDASGGPGSLPLMAFALTRLWDTQHNRQIRFADYRRFGGVAGAINEHAERVYDRLLAEDQAQQAKAIMLGLVRSRGGASEAVSRAVVRSRFDGPLVDHLCRTRLLASETSGGEPLVRLAHESLVRAWARFARWVDEDADFQRWLATMEERVTDDELLSESRLGPAEQWLAERPADIPAEVVELVEHSRSVWRRRVAELEHANAEAEARRLAAASELLTATTAPGGTLPLALAMESIRTLWTLEGDTALRRALRTAPVPVVRIPNPGDGLPITRLTTTGSHVIRGKELFEVDLDRREYRPVRREDGPGDRITGDGRAELRTDTHRVVVVDTRTGATLADDHDRLPVVTAVLSEDGTHLTVVRGQSVKDGDHDVIRHATITTFGLSGGQMCHRMTTPALRGSLCFSEGHTVLAATTNRYDRTVHYKRLASTTVYDLVRGRELATVDHDGDPTLCRAFSPDRKLLAAGSNNVDSCGDSHSGGLEMFDLTNGGRQIYRLDQYLPVRAVVFAPSGDRLAVAVGDVRHTQTPGFGILVEVATGRELQRLHHDYPVDDAGFNADGSRVFFGGHRSARVFTVRNGDEQLRVDHEQDLKDTVFAPDGRGLVTVTQERGGPTRVFRSGSVAVARFDWSADDLLWHAEVSPNGGRVIASYAERLNGGKGSGRGVSWVVDTMSATRHAEIPHGPHAWAMAVSANGSHMALTDGLRFIVHDLDGDQAPLEVDHGSTHGVKEAWFTEDGDRVFTVANNLIRGHEYHTVIRSTDVKTGSTLSSVSVADFVWTVSSDGALAAVGTEHEDPIPKSEHSQIAVTDTAGAKRFWFRARRGQALRFAPSGEWIASVCDRSLVLRRTTDGEQLWSTALGVDEDTHLQETTIVTSPTSTCLAVTAGTLGQTTTILVDARGGRHIAKFESTRRMSASFSLDGHRAAVVADGTAHVVDLDSAATLCAIEHEVHHIDHASFVGPKGKHLLTKDHCGFRVSSIDSTSLLHEADARLARELTDSERRRYLRHS